jgi:hypothetical protein
VRGVGFDGARKVDNARAQDEKLINIIHGHPLENAIRLLQQNYATKKCNYFSGLILRADLKQCEQYQTAKAAVAKPHRQQPD